MANRNWGHGFNTGKKRGFEDGYLKGGKDADQDTAIFSAIAAAGAALLTLFFSSKDK